MGGQEQAEHLQVINLENFYSNALHKAKISNQPISENLNDGLKLNATYITNISKMCSSRRQTPKRRAS